MYGCDADESCRASFPMLYRMKRHAHDKHGSSTYLDPKCSYENCGKVLKTGLGCLHHKWVMHEDPEGPPERNKSVQIDKPVKVKTPKTRTPNKKKTKKTEEAKKTVNESLFEKFQDGHFDLNSYIGNDLIAKEGFNTNVSRAVDSLVRYLQQEVTLDVDRVIKGGSLGKGTALHENSDIDLVLFANDFQSMEDFHSKLPRCLEEVTASMKSFSSQEGHEVKVNGTSPHGVKVKIKPKGYGSYIDVDILPAFDNLTHNGKVETYRKIGKEKKKKRENYSSSLTELQRDFVKEQPTPVKRLIVLAKHWMKSLNGPSRRRLPNSYLIELITIHAWEQAGKPENFDIKQGFYGVLKTLKNHHSLRASWGSIDGIPTPKFTSSPVVVDPANPYNNVCSRTKSKAWSRVAEEVQKYMDSPYFDGFHGNPNGW